MADFVNIDLSKIRITEDGRPDYETVANPHCVYVMESAGLVKVGYANCPKRRHRQIQKMSAVPVSLFASVWLVSCGQAMKVEGMAHQALRQQRVYSEWFRTDKENALSVVVRCAESLGYRIYTDDDRQKFAQVERKLKKLSAANKEDADDWVTSRVRAFVDANFC